MSDATPATVALLVSLFVAPLAALGVPYMVTGAVAAIVYGGPRLTNDVDIAVSLGVSDAGRLHAAFDRPELHVPPIEVLVTGIGRPAHGRFNLIHAPTALEADISPAGDDPLHRRALARRRTVRVADTPMSIAPPEHVVVRRLQYLRDGGSSKHVRDVRCSRSSARRSIRRRSPGRRPRSGWPSSGRRCGGRGPGKAIAGREACGISPRHRA